MHRRRLFLRDSCSSHSFRLSFRLFALPLHSFTLLSLHFKLPLLLFLLFEALLSFDLFLLLAVLRLLEFKSFALLLLNLEEAETLLGLLLLLELLLQVSLELFGDFRDLGALLGFLRGFKVLIRDLLLGLIVEVGGGIVH